MQHCLFGDTYLDDDGADDKNIAGNGAGDKPPDDDNEA